LTHHAHHAELHKLEWKWTPPKEAKLDFYSLERPEELDALTEELFSIPINQFVRRTSAIGQFQNIYTYNQLIDLGFRLTKFHDDDLEEVWEQRLETITIQGSAFDCMTFNTPHILRCTDDRHFRLREVHSKIDILSDRYAFPEIKKRYDVELFTTKCKTGSYKEEGRTIFIGNKAANGKRLNIYEGWTVHEELPEGTVRSELQLYGRDAYNFFHSEKLRDVDLTTKTIGIIKGLITFREQGADSNKDRLPVADFWKYFTEEYVVVKLPRQLGLPPTFERTTRALTAYLHQKRQVLGDSGFVRAVYGCLDKAGLLQEFTAMLAV